MENVEICEEDHVDEKLVGDEIKMFRTIAARMNFLAQDCQDLRFPAEEICKEMSGPTQRFGRRSRS